MSSFEGLIITLPLPPSANALVQPVTFMSKRGGKVTHRLAKTQAASDYRKQVHAMFATWPLLPPPLEGPLSVSYKVFVTTISSDGSNREKALFDACNSIVWIDDRQVVEWRGQKRLAIERLDQPGQTGIRLRVVRAEGFSIIAGRLAKTDRSGTVRLAPSYVAPRGGP